MHIETSYCTEKKWKIFFVDIDILIKKINRQKIIIKIKKKF